ncbi:Uncharacterized protein PECH_006474 [Penicillium ucsense]|uniref:Dicer-like protein 1 n=1 Tax=Penicillium ucsense TaxID=2839758 RepID=A0A8J8WKC8_9EURO|nr:Uncharacterized protein PECM_005265 [Penicillium ucsense]KAF7735572.1 Uncharacterized protein PECH_006474 [Penicillium ucsense]
MPSLDLGDNVSMGSSEDSERELEDQVIPDTHTLQRQRTQEANFQFLLKQHAERGPEFYSESRGHYNNDDKFEDDLYSVPSISQLLKRQEAGRGDLRPRVYQLELFERAKTENTIAVLDTGSGKTLIAVLLLKNVLQQELISRGDGKPPRIAFFLAHSVTLVYQQAAVLRHNLDQKVAFIYGAMGPDLWEKSTWEEWYTKNMVIVCTAEILNHCLLNGFIKMDQINILIFDEAHHAKKSHPYARMIREFYLKAQPSERPRIFGMTASPVDGKTKMTEAAARLEALLNSRIATTADLAGLREVVNKPIEETWTFPKLDPPYATKMYSQLKRSFGKIKSLEPVFRFAWAASSELGEWCADQIWRRALREDVIPHLESSMESHAALNSPDQAQKEREQELSAAQEAYEMVQSYKLQDPTAPNQLSSKVKLLIERLTLHFSESSENKCIVFTERRNTAKTLLHLCERLSLKNLRPGILIGSRNSDITGNVTFRNQFEVTSHFQDGKVNCLFATAVAEEGLDIPDCNFVIRFDLYNTLIQYIQSRGRARHTRSRFVTMIEAHNEKHKKKIQEVRDSETLMRAFCETLPKDRLLRGYEYDLDLKSLLGKERGKRTYTIASTGAKLTYEHAIDVLGRYGASLQYREEDIERGRNIDQRGTGKYVNYIIISMGDKYGCEVILPDNSPVRGVLGTMESSKAMAKGSAAFDTCLLLRKSSLLDSHFRPIFRRTLPLMRNAKLAIASKKQEKYDRRCKPSFWSYGIGSVPELLYVTVIKLEPIKPLSRHLAPMLLLTRRKLPSLPSFPVYLDNDVETTVRTVCVEGSITLTGDDLDCLTAFMRSVFRDVFHKVFEPLGERFPYWLAPARDGMVGIMSEEQPRELIDWDALEFTRGHGDWRWSPDLDPSVLLKTFMYDPWSGKYRYFPLRIDPDLRPSDVPPAWVPRRRDINMENIMNYSSSLGKKSRNAFLEQCNWNQPVIHVETVCLRRNFLDPGAELDKAEKAVCVVCPGPLILSALPLTFVTSCLAFPAIISRIESYLIAWEAGQHLNLDLQLHLALEALTKDSDNTDEHRELQIHVQRGMGKNYERLEFLGDSFLKMGTSIALYCQRPDDNEYDYHVYRMCLVCNKNLYERALNMKVYEFIRNRGFSRNTWFPPGPRLLQGRDISKNFEMESSHELGKKTIADVCEALIAAALLSGGKSHRMDSAVRAVTLFAHNDTLQVTHTATCWADYYSSYTKPKWQNSKPNGYELDLARQIQTKLGYNFRCPTLLRSAFTHSSLPRHLAIVPCYQRLEFLGDALLDMVCVEYLFNRFPDRDPQWLTEHKMAIVSNKFLGALTVHLGLHRHLQHADGPIQGQITRYALEMQEAEEKSAGKMDYWLHTSDAPKCLPDMLEAYIAAIFVDSEFDYSVVQEFFGKHIQPYFEDISLYDTFANRQPTTYLFHQVASIYECRDISVKVGKIPDTDSDQPRILAAVMIHGQCVGEAVGSSSRYAKIRASERATEALKSLLPADFRIKFTCDCGSADPVE